MSVLGVLLTSVLGASAIANFPRVATKSLKSPTSSERLTFRRTPGVGSGVDQQWELRLRDDKGRSKLVMRFDRNVDVAWAPDGHRFFVNDNGNSASSDCSVYERSGTHFIVTDVGNLAHRISDHPYPAKLEASHFYVTCLGWLNAGRLAGSITGHTDENPSQDFDYRFTLSVGNHRLAWGKP